MHEQPSEIQEHKELFTRRELVASLKENPSNLSPLHVYMEEREKEVDAQDGGGLALILECVDIHLEVGFLQAAIDALEDVITIARNEGNNEMVLELNQKLHTVHLS